MQNYHISDWSIVYGQPDQGRQRIVGMQGVFSTQDFQLNSIEKLAIFYILWNSSQTDSLWKFRKSSICLRAN